jgi:hypothetical protein
LAASFRVGMTMLMRGLWEFDISIPDGLRAVCDRLISESLCRDPRRIHRSNLRPDSATRLRFHRLRLTLKEAMSLSSHD